MLTRPDSQSFTRFLASLGVFLCVVAILAPALVLRETDVLRIPATEIAGLTPEGEREILRRQRLSADLGTAIPYVGAVAFLLGVGLVLYAAPRLRRQEEAQERRSTAELEKLLNELEPQDEQDRRRKTEADVRAELLTEEQRPSRSEIRQHRPPPHTEAARQYLQERMRHAREVESRVLQRIVEGAPAAYEARPNVKIAGEPPLLLDGILVSRIEQLRDVVVEIKLARGPALVKNLGNRIGEALAVVSRYRGRSGRAAIAWLVIVVDDGATERAESQIQRLTKDVSDQVVVSVVSEHEIPELTVPFDRFL